MSRSMGRTKPRPCVYPREAFADTSAKVAEVIAVHFRHGGTRATITGLGVLALAEDVGFFPRPCPLRLTLTAATFNAITPRPLMRGGVAGAIAAREAVESEARQLARTIGAPVEIWAPGRRGCDCGSMHCAFCGDSSNSPSQIATVQP